MGTTRFGKRKFEITVLRETGVVFEGSCEALLVPSEHGEVAILPEHTPMIAKLSPGDIVIKEGRTRRAIVTVQSGVLHVGSNAATVLVDL